MDNTIGDLPSPPAPASRGGLIIPLLILLCLGIGVATSVGFLLWWDRQRWAKWEQSYRDTLTEMELSAKAAKEREDAAKGPQTPADALGQVNEQFRSVYRTVRAERLVHTSPVVIADGDDLILLRDANRTSVSVIPRLYHDLKAYAHIPLAAYLMTGLDERKELPAERQIEITKCLERLPEIRADLKKKGFAPAVESRQVQILDETEAFLKACQKQPHEKGSNDKKGIDPKARSAFAAKLRDAILGNVRDAARAQIDAMHAQMLKWKAELKEDEWKRLKVVVIGSAMPRKNHIAVQYFAYLLNERGEDKRIIYAESLFEEKRALDLLGTHALDEELGKVFFAEGTRLKRDLLGDDAEQILEEMRKRDERKQ